MRPIEPIARQAYEHFCKSDLTSVPTLQSCKVTWDALPDQYKQVWLDIASLVWEYALMDTGD